jgi:hypothetical protein
MIEFEPTTSLFKVQFESIQLRTQLNCGEAEETGVREPGKREGYTNLQKILIVTVLGNLPL